MHLEHKIGSERKPQNVFTHKTFSIDFTHMHIIFDVDQRGKENNDISMYTLHTTQCDEHFLFVYKEMEAF